MATILHTDITLDEKEDNEDDDRGQGREEELQYYRTLAELPFGSLHSYTCCRVYLSHQFEIYFTQTTTVFILTNVVAARSNKRPNVSDIILNTEETKN